MSIWCILGGGLQYESTNGIKYTHGMSSLGGPTETTTNAPITGLRGITDLLNDLVIFESPATPTSAEQPAFAANASRNWFALHAEVIINDYYSGSGEMYFCGTLIGLRSLAIAPFSLTTRLTGTANAAITYTATTLSDTRVGRDFVASGVVAGDTIINATGRGVVASVTTTVLTLTAAGWAYATPTAGAAYTILSAMSFKFHIYDTDTTTLLGSSTAFTPSAIIHNTTPLVIDWKCNPTSGSTENKLTVNGSEILSVSGGTTGTPGTIAPTTGWSFRIKSKTNDYKGSYQAYNIIYYDDLTQTGVDTYPLTYSATATERHLVTYRKAKSGGSSYHDAWTKSAGSNAGSLLDEIRDTDATDYITSASAVKQSWECDSLGSADYTINSYDTIYAIQTIGSTRGPSTSAFSTMRVFHVTGAGVEDTGRHCYESTQKAAIVWCNYLDPSGSAWTYTTANAVQTGVECVSFSSGLLGVAVAGQLVCFKKGPAQSLVLPMRNSPRQNTLLRM